MQPIAFFNAVNILKLIHIFFHNDYRQTFVGGRFKLNE